MNAKLSPALFSLILSLVVAAPSLGLQRSGMLALGRDITHLEIADVTGDGISDLIVLEDSSIPLHVYRGLGGLSYASPVSYTLNGTNPDQLVIGDMDGDGDIDMVAGTSTYQFYGWGFSGGVNFFTNNGSGLFTLSQFEEGISALTDMALADVDSDGDMDVVQAGEYSNGATVVYNKSFGLTTQANLLLGQGCVIQGGHLTLVDWNQDNKMDVWVSGVETSNDHYCYFLGHGNGFFSKQTISINAFPPYPAVRLELYDVDLDSDLDMVFTAGYNYDAQHGDSIIVYRNQGNGTLGAMELFPIINTGSLVFHFDHLATGDWNSDGLIDFALPGAGNSGNQLGIAYGNSAGTFSRNNASYWSPYYFLTNHWEPVGIALAHMDGDNTKDIAVWDSQSDVITFYTTSSTCICDLSHDQVVGFSDLTILLSMWGATGFSFADLNRDEIVGFADLTRLLSNWGECS